MPKIQVTIDLYDEVADEADATGLTAEAYDEFVACVLQFGDIIDGPTLDK